MIQHHTASVDYYNAIEDFLAESDLVETDVYIQGLNGKFRISALTFGQQEEINQKSLRKVDDSDKTDLNHQEWVLWTLVHGVVRPKLNYTQAKQFISKNGQVVNALADEIWNIGRIPKKTFDEYISKLKELNELEQKAEEEAKRKTRTR